MALSLPFRPEFSFQPTEPCFHGGVIAAFADAAGHAAVAVFHGKPTPTITLQVDFLATAEGKALAARGILRKLGRSVSRADVELHCAGKLVAIARGTFSTRTEAMKAIVVREFGPVGAAGMEEVATPELRPGEVVVRVAAVAANFVDTLVLQGKYQFLPERPFSPGKLPPGPFMPWARA